MSRRRHWYHCTDRRGDPEWVAVRRAPLSKASTEPDTPRLCVAPTVAQALAAAWWSGSRPLSVYITEARRTVPPTGVWDAVITGERWIIPPVRLHLLATIPAKAVLEAQLGLDPVVGDGEWSRVGRRFVNMVELVRRYVPAAHEPWLVEFSRDVSSYLQSRERVSDVRVSDARVSAARVSDA